MAMKKHVWFGACFLVMSTAGALLLTWSIWWLAVVGPSVPARRPFFAPAQEVPALVAGSSSATKGTPVVFRDVLAGGWPTSNSVVRVVAAALAVCASFSFAFVATLARERTTRVLFGAVLGLTALTAAAAFALDMVALIRTTLECNMGKCETNVPRVLLQDATLRCICSPDGWFWVTLTVDFVLMASAVACLALTLRPLLAKREAYN